jgi:hypothetical protein
LQEFFFKNKNFFEGSEKQATSFETQAFQLFPCEDDFSCCNHFFDKGEERHCQNVFMKHFWTKAKGLLEAVFVCFRVYGAVYVNGKS